MPDQIWADEGGLMVRFARAANDGVCIQILDVSGRGQRVVAEATLGNWRWDRAVSAMATERATGRASSPLAHMADALRLKADLEDERDHYRARLAAAEAALAAVEKVFEGAQCLGDHCEATDDGESQSLTLAHESDCPLYYLKRIRAVATPTHPGAP